MLRYLIVQDQLFASYQAQPRSCASMLRSLITQAQLFPWYHKQPQISLNTATTVSSRYWCPAQRYVVHKATTTAIDAKLVIGAHHCVAQ